MTPFMNADFLLKTETAKKLYHEHAEVMRMFLVHLKIHVEIAILKLLGRMNCKHLLF